MKPFLTIRWQYALIIITACLLSQACNKNVDAIKQNEIKLTQASPPGPVKTVKLIPVDLSVEYKGMQIALLLPCTEAYYVVYNFKCSNDCSKPISLDLKFNIAFQGTIPGLFGPPLQQVAPVNFIIPANSFLTKSVGFNIPYRYSRGIGNTSVYKSVPFTITANIINQAVRESSNFSIFIPQDLNLLNNTATASLYSWLPPRCDKAVPVTK